VDADYRGEVSVLLINHGDEPFTIRRGERIAQLVIAAVCQANLTEVASLSPTDRGSGGFGSTGRKSILAEARIAPHNRLRSHYFAA
jgi:dUTP pyrophosphatase